MHRLLALTMLIIAFLTLIRSVSAQDGVLSLCVQDFVDTDQSGLPNDGEISLGQGEVLVSNLDGTVVASLTITTGEDCMLGLQSGDYTVSVTLPEGYTATTETTFAINLTESAIINVGATSPTPIGAPPSVDQQNVVCVLVFHDENRNGERESTEALMSGIDVNLIRDGHIIDTLLTNATTVTCFNDLAVGKYQIEIPPSANHIMVSRRDIAVDIQDVGYEVTARFAAIPVNPLSDEARFPTVGDGELTFDNNTRLMLSGVGAFLAVFFMIGLGTLLYGLIRH